MFRSFAKPLIFAVACLSLSAAAVAGDLVVTEVDTSKYARDAGYAVVPAENILAGQYIGDKAPSSALEIVRPGLEAFSIGRVYTSSPVLRVAPSKRSFEAGERAVFLARNVQFTKGQNVRIYVEICAPVRMTICYDVCVASTRCVNQPCGPSYRAIGSIR